MSETVQPRPNPYVGPRAFQRGEALFGRDHEVLRLLDLLLAERIVLLYSPSGAGKTSLVEAALIPKLESRRFRVLPTMRVSLAPAETLSLSANRYVLSLLLSLEEDLSPEQQTPLAELASLTLAEYLDRQPATGEGPDRIALIVDQFEEILTLNPADRAAKAEFFAQVGEALEHPRRWALFALREEFVAGLDPYLNALPTRLSTRYRLELLGLDAAKEAMQRPARAAGVEFSDGAAEQLVRDLAMVSVQQPDGSTTPVPGDSVEPVQLQVVCRRLWDRLPTGHAKIGLGDVEDVGDVDTALRAYYAERVAAIAAATSVPERAIREWVDRQLITEQGIRGQVLQGLDQSQGLDNRAIWLLEDAHLVRAEKRRGATWFELAHDRLIEPVRRDNAQWRAAKLNTLQRQAGLWNSAQRPDGLLLRGQELAEAKRWAAGHTRELENFEHDFLTRSQERHKVETRQKILVVALAVMFILAVVAAIFSGIQAGIARQQQATAVAALDMVATSDSKARGAELAAAIFRDDAAEAQALADQLRETAEAASAAMTFETAQVRKATADAAQAEADQLRGTAEAASTAAVAAQQTAEAERDRVIGPKVDPRIKSLLTLDLKGSVYKLEEIIWMDPDESRDLHHIFVDVVDTDGRRLAGEKVRVSWPGGEAIIPVEEKPGEPWGGWFAMYATLDSYAVEVVAASGASDKVAGLGMGTPQEPTAKYHTSFGLRFVRPEPTPLPSDTPTATPSLTPTPSPTANVTHLLLNGPMQVAGATTLETLTNKMVESFKNATGYIPPLRPEYIGTDPGFERFCVKNSEIDLVMATGAGKDTDYKERCGAAERPLVGFQVAWRPADSRRDRAEPEPLTLYTTPSILRTKPQVAAFIRYYLENATQVIETNAFYYEPVGEDIRTDALQRLEALLQFTIYDLDGTERDWDWLTATFGVVTLDRGTGTASVTVLHAVEPRAVLVVYVENSEGNAMDNVPVVWYWPDAPELRSEMQACGLDRGIIGHTNSSGFVSFGMGAADYYFPSSGQIGPHVVWVAVEGTDCLGGLGMLGGTNHMHLNSVWRMP